VSTTPSFVLLKINVGLQELFLDSCLNPGFLKGFHKENIMFRFETITTFTMITKYT